MDPTPDRSPVAVDIAVAWGEMDAFQHVNNVVYLRWAETARIAYFDRVRLMEGKDGEGVAPILAKATVEYLRPVTYPDRVRVDASVARIGNTSFVMRHQMWSEAQQALVARGESVIVLYDYRAGKPVAIGEPLRAAIAAVEATAA